MKVVEDDQFIVEVTKERSIQSTKAKDAATFRKSCAPGDAPGHARLIRLQMSLLNVAKVIGSSVPGRMNRGPFLTLSVSFR